MFDGRGVHVGSRASVTFGRRLMRKIVGVRHTSAPPASSWFSSRTHAMATWTSADIRPQSWGCKLKKRCTKADQRVIRRWQHEHVLEGVQRRLDENPQAMRVRRETVEHPFGTIKARMGATHFLMKRLHNVKTEMSLAVLAYNLTRVMNLVGKGPLITAIREFGAGILAIVMGSIPLAASPASYAHYNA